MSETLLQLVIVIVAIFIVYMLVSRKNDEGLCIKKSYGYVTDVPASAYANANSALVHTDSLGQAPLGDPRYWIPNRNPITQGQYGLYQTETLPLSETQPYDRSKLAEIAKIMPVYTDKPLPPQC